MKKFILICASMFMTACMAATAPNSNLGATNVIQGMSTERLSKINDVMQGYIDQNKLVGISTLVARNGEVVHFAAQGLQNRELNIPLSRDSIFRIYSMTKPVTAVAALTLWEQGKFHMNDPIEMYLPELKDLQVYVSGEGDTMVTEPQQRPIRIIDLFLHTAGFSYGFTQSPVDKLYQKMIAEQMNAEANIDSAEKVLSNIAQLPLNHQPGTKWHYGVNTDIIGFLVERLTGMKLGEYMAQEIFGPLEMNDTAFYVPENKLARLNEIYTVDAQGKTSVRPPDGDWDFKSDPPVHNGGGGLVSTMDDYHKFAQMLLNNGEYKGTRILGRKTVEYMRTNHLPASLIPYSPNAEGQGYGLAVSVTVDEGQLKYMGSEGNFGWSGLASTYVRIDPAENMIILGMSQFVPINFYRYQHDLRNLSYQSLVD